MPPLNENDPSTARVQPGKGVGARAGPVVAALCLAQGRPEPPSVSLKVSALGVCERPLPPSQGGLNEATPLGQMMSCKLVSLMWVAIAAMCHIMATSAW